MARKERSPEGQARAEFIETFEKYKDLTEQIRKFPSRLEEDQFIQWKGLRDDRDTVDEKLRELAKVAKIRRGEENGSTLFLTRVHVSTYSTQGFGAWNYARARAEMIAHRCRGRCFARVLADRDCFEVHVEVETEIDVEIARRLPEPPLREWLKLCWRGGVNPRVYQPFLPHGLEEKLGIGMNGEDLPVKAKEKTP